MARKMTMGSKMAIATASCKKQGHSTFKKGSTGAACREKMAEGITRSHTIVKGPAKRKK